MRFRFTLDSETLGALILEKNPMGWNEMEILIKRGTDTHGFFYEQAVNLAFYCGAGKEYIDEVRSVEGIDAQIGITIQVACGCEPGSDMPDYSEDYSDDYGSMSEGDCQWEELYEGILDMKTWESDKNFTRVNIIESGFFQKVRNRLDTVVDLLRTDSVEGEELTDLQPYDLNLHSKAIVLTSEIEMLAETYEEEFIASALDNMYFTFPFDTITVDEFETPWETPTPPLIGSQEVSEFVKTVWQNETGEPVELTIDYVFNGALEEVLNNSRIYDVKLVLRIADNPFVLNGTTTEFIDLADFGNKNMLANQIMHQDFNITGTITRTIAPNDALFFYFIFLNYDNTSILTTTLGVQPIEVRVTATTVSITDDTVGKAFKVFEAGAKISEVISDRQDAFRSTYLGRKDSVPYSYDTNGCGSFASLLSGFWLRGYPITGERARTTKMSMNTYFKSLSCIWNLGLGIEKIDDVNYVVMERMDYFYDSNTVLLTFDNVPNIIIQEAEEYYCARVNVGYNRWETEFRNGLAEFNSKRFLDLGIRAVDNTKTIYSDFVTGGYPYEAARRQQYSDTISTDTEYDELNFMICLNRTVDDNDIPTMLDVAEKDENFDTVNNVLSPETSINLRVTPYHNLLRHSDILNPALLKYPGREIKFMGGEGNYKAETEFTFDLCDGSWNNELLNEGQNIQWDDDNNTDNNPLWIPEVATFSYPISFTDFKVLKNNPKGVIMVSETSENHIPYYLLEVKYIPANGGLAEFKLLRAYQA